MGNPENIKPYEFKPGRSSEEAAAAGRKGGKASGRARRMKKSFREAARWVLSMEVDGTLPDGQSARLTVYESLVLDLLQQAKDPDCKYRLQAFQQLQELAGESPRMHEVDLKRREIELKKQAQEADSW